MLERVNEKLIIEQHLDFMHKGIEEDFKDICPLCRAYLANKRIECDCIKNIGINVNDSVGVKPVFGR